MRFPYTPLDRCVEPKRLVNLGLLALFSICLFPVIRAQNVADELQTKAVQLSAVWDRGSLTEARAVFLQAAEEWAKLGDTEQQAECLREAGREAISLGNKQEAFTLLKRAERISSGKDDSKALIKVLSDLSTLAYDLGNSVESKRFMDEALRLAAESNDVEAIANAYFAAGEFYYFKNDLTTAAVYHTKSIEAFREKGDSRGETKGLVSLGWEQFQLDDFQAASVSFDTALRASRASGDLKGQAAALKGIGTVHNAINNKQLALKIYGDAIDLFPKDVDLSELATLHNGLASVYEYFGQYQSAILNRETALKIFQKEGWKLGQYTTLASLGEHYLASGEVAKAESAFHHARKMATEQGDDFHLAIIDEGISKLNERRGDYSSALDVLGESLKRFNNQNRREKSRIHLNLGRIYLKLNQHSLAKKHLQIAAELNKEVKDKFMEAAAQFHLAELSAKEGNFQDASDSIRNSIKLTEEISSDSSNAGLRRTFVSSVFDRYEFYIWILMKTARAENTERPDLQALRLFEMVQSRSMLENLALSEANFTADADAEVVQKEKQIRFSLNAKSDKLIELLSRNADKPEVDKLESEIGELQNQLEEIKGELKQKSPIYSAIKDPPPFDVAEFQSQVLDDNSLLLEFSLGKEESYLWAVGKTTFDSYVLPPREQIESRIEKLRGLLSQNTMLPDESVDVFQKRIADARAEYSREARTLSNDLLGQAADKLAGKRLIVVADGKIHYFPLAALPLPNSETDDPILLTNEVVYEPSAAALMLIKKISASGKVPQKDLFLVSDPVFSKIDNRLENNGSANTGFVATVLGHFRSFDSLESLPRLPASSEEANSITKVVGAAATTARTGFAANRENILNAGIADYKVLHFATHGLLDEKRPELSGIVLSLFDESGRQQDGGFIRLQDVYGMNLNADLVVLSACDTGLGKEIKGEGLMSLNNAFLQAGAKSVVSSLWKVDDAVTKELMTEFYSGMASENLTSSQALRQAQIRLHNDPRFSSPFYWASFTAQGNFSTTPQFSRGYNSWIYIPGIVLIALCGVYWFRKIRSRRSPDSVGIGDS